MINPAMGGNPPAMESQGQVDNRFIRNCKARFPEIEGETIDTVLEALEEEALKLLKAEIRNDPEQLGYRGKNSEQIARLASTSYLRKETRKMTDTRDSEGGTLKDVEVDIEQLPRLVRIWNGVPNVPNIVTPDDVKKALR
jgi:hypothetical protein